MYHIPKQKIKSAFLRERRMVFIMGERESVVPESAKDIFDRLAGLKGEVGNPEISKIQGELMRIFHEIGAKNQLTEEDKKNIKEYAEPIHQMMRETANHLPENEKESFLELHGIIMELLNNPNALGKDFLVLEFQKSRSDITEVIVRYSDLGEYEKKILDTWKNNNPPLGSEEKVIVERIQKEFVGTDGFNGIGQKALEKTQDPKEYFKIITAVSNTMFLLGMDGSSYLAKAVESPIAQQRLEERGKEMDTHITEILKPESFSIANPEIRTEINLYKKALLTNTNPPFGEINDYRLQNMVTVILNKGKCADETQRGNAIQVILDITEGKSEYSESEIRRKIGEMNKEYSILEAKTPGRVGEQLAEMRKKEGKYQIIKQIAAYELAEQAKEEMAKAKLQSEGKLDKNTPKGEIKNKVQEIFGGAVGSKVGNVAIREGSGFTVFGKNIKIDPKALERSGDMARKILTPSGIATVFVGLTGILMVIGNLFIFIQSKGRNTQALAFAAAGVAAMKGSAYALKNNTIDTIMNPENRIFNKLSSITNTDRDILDELKCNIHLYKQIDFNGENGKKIFREFPAKQKQEHDNQYKEMKEKKKKGYDVNIPDYEQKVAISDFLISEKTTKKSGKLSDTKKTDALKKDEETTEKSARLSGILLPGYDEKYLQDLPEETESQKITRYKTIDFLYSNGIKNADLDAAAQIAEMIREVKPGEPLSDQNSRK